MEAWVRYVIDTFRNIYEYTGPLPIQYGMGDETGVQINDSGGSFFEKNRQITTSGIRWYAWDDNSIPILFPDPDHKEIITEDGDRVVIHHDLLASAFYFLSGWHEYHREYGADPDRYRYHESLMHDLDIVNKPVVNYYFEIIQHALEMLDGDSVKPGRSEVGSHALALTHDIDSLYSGWIEDGFSALKNGRIFSGLQIGINRMRGKDTRFNLRSISSLEKKWGVEASYYFLAREGMINGLNHADYHIDEPRIRGEIEYLKHEGHEIGIHGSKGAHVNEDIFREDIKRLNEPVTGGRYHYLNFDIRQTPGVLDRSGLRYDSTLGFAEQIGFRNGLAHPFYLFNLKEMKPTEVLEIPMIVMDATLRNDEYMGLAPEDSFRVVKPVLKEVEKFGGAVSVLWHNGYFTDFKFRGWQEVLERIMKFSKKRGGFVGTAARIEQAYRTE